MENTPNEKSSPKLFPLIAERLHEKKYSTRTEQAYVQWIKRYILHHGKRHPREMGVAEVEAYLTHLAVVQNVSASTQNQARSALFFLYQEVLGVEMPWLENVTQARAIKRLPVILTKQEVQGLLGNLDGTMWLVASLLYGSGLRVMECLRLRVNDVNFAKREILVRDAKGYKNRVTLLPLALVEPLKQHLNAVQALHHEDLSAGLGAVFVSEAISKKFPNAERDWGWQYVFSSLKLSLDPKTNLARRHHMDEKTVQRAVKKAAESAKITKLTTPHTLRHSFAAHLLEGGNDVHVVQDLMGHVDVASTMIYTHVINQSGRGVSSPLDVI